MITTRTLIARARRPDLREGEVRATTEFMYSNSSFPASIDWRKKGAVTKVKNQQQARPVLPGLLGSYARSGARSWVAGSWH